ncbi:MAG: PE-PPE domain-containing protein [Mycobacterium sp.]
MRNIDTKLFRAALRILTALPLVVATAPPAAAEVTVKTASPQVQLAATKVLIMGGTGTPTPNQQYMDAAINTYIRPALGEADYEPVAVYTPEEGLGFLPGETMDINHSALAGVPYLEAAIASYPDQPIVVFGYSQSGAMSAYLKNKMAAYADQHPEAPVPDVTFVWVGGGARQNGSTSFRDVSSDAVLDSRARTDTPFKTVDIAFQYDISSDQPIYQLNFVAALNVLLGGLYVHNNYLPLPNLPVSQFVSQVPSLDGLQGVTAPGIDTTYYFIPSDHLPLFGPLRSLGVPEALIDIIEPVVRVIVEWGYDRTIPPWQPTSYSSGLPNIDAGVAITQLVNAVGEGIANAFKAFGIQVPAATTPGTATAGAVAAPTRAAVAAAPSPRRVNRVSATAAKAQAKAAASSKPIGSGLSAATDNSSTAPTLARSRGRGHSPSAASSKAARVGR